MGVLDQLRKEAEALAAEKARETSERAKAEERAREQLQPTMQAAYRYFCELKQHLEMVGRKVEATYELEGAGRVEGLVQGSYGVATESPEAVERFTFRCVFSRNGVLQVSQADAPSAASYRDYLRDNGLKAKVRDTGRGSALFMVEPAIPVVVEFSADYQRVAIVVRVRNLGNIGVDRHVLPVDQVNAKLLDELAKAILRTENRFEEMVGGSLSRTGKVRLKEQIQAAMRKKELQDAQVHSEAEPITRRFSRTLLGRLGRS